MEHTRVCREEERAFPREREPQELPSLSDRIPACSMMKITEILVIAEPGVLVESEDMAGLWPMAH